MDAALPARLLRGLGVAVLAVTLTSSTPTPDRTTPPSVDRTSLTCRCSERTPL